MKNTIRNILALQDVRVEDTAFTGSKMTDYCLPTINYYSYDNGKLMFKNTVEIKTFEQVAAAIPMLNRLSCANKSDIPFYVAGLDPIIAAIQNKEKIAVEGGPCLFSADEVNVIVCCKNGIVKRFDFACGKSYNDNRNGFEDETLVQYLLTKRDRIPLGLPRG